jgi:hypothetical protein
MSTITIATDAHGNVLGAIQHPPKGKVAGEFRAGVSFGPGAELHIVDLTPDLDMTRVTDAVKYHDLLRKHVIGTRGKTAS